MRKFNNFCFPVQDCTYNPSIDFEEVEQLDSHDFDVNYYLEIGSIPANLLPSADSYNGIDNVASVGCRVSDCFDAVKASRSITKRASTPKTTPATA